MRTLACHLLLLLAAAPLHAQDDPLKSPACGAALAALQSARNANAADVESLRAGAAGACLGSSAVPARPPRVLQEPIAVPPPRIEPPAPVAPLPAPMLAPPPVAIERAPSPTHCDVGGCWSSDGTHLRMVPPSLAGPRGLCTQQGGLLLCP